MLLGALEVHERTIVLLDVVTGLRASELFGLEWTDIDFVKNEIRVTRSIVPKLSARARPKRLRNQFRSIRSSRERSAPGRLTRSTRPQPTGSSRVPTVRAESRTGTSR